MKYLTSRLRCFRLPRLNASLMDPLSREFPYDTIDMTFFFFFFFLFKILLTSTISSTQHIKSIIEITVAESKLSNLYQLLCLSVSRLPDVAN